MKKKLHLALLILALCLPSLCIHAQENTSRQIFYQAESEYKIGHIEQAIQLLQGNLSNFGGNLKQSAYRLLALCYLSEDRDDEARYYAEQLVKLNNYYNSTDDPARFQDLVNELKVGFATTITTASRQSETINEAPAPVTIITAEMIGELGYNKNLAQILAAYVPGMAEITAASAEVNLAMHGAYAFGQELILVMENGHRLNNHFNNSGPVSYSISTEKIDHIEVLRGPTSSLYGNVALSAVVNVITKSGYASNGIKAKYGYASFNTHKADLTIGSQFLDIDLFIWASLYNSDGQMRHISDGEGYFAKYFKNVEQNEYYKKTFIGPEQFYVDGYKDRPTYDAGLTFKYKGFNLMFSRKNIKKVLPYTSSYGCYNYDRYSAIFGMKPGSGNESTHAEIGYSRQLGDLLLDATLYSDWYNISEYDVQYDSIVAEYFDLFNESESILDENGNMSKMVESKGGGFTVDSYNERSVGAIVRASSDYKIGKMKGSVLAGGQYENFSLQSGFFFYGKNSKEIEGGSTSYEEITKDGKEKILSFFIQDKHYCLPQLILNAGFRYDLKFRQSSSSVGSFSPRLALMFVPNERFSLKLSYSEAYADLSFSNRYVIKIVNENSKPQHLSAMQLTAMGSVPSLHLNYEANVFYNRYSNLLCWLARESEDLEHMARLSNIGFEGTARWAYKRLSANFTFCFIRDISAYDYYYNKSEKMVCGIPHMTLNLHGAWKLMQKKYHELKVYGLSKYVGKKLNYRENGEEDDFFVDGKFIFDIGVKYRYKQRLQLAFDCENVLDTDFYFCGPNMMNIPDLQRGRTLMASLSYQF